MVSCFNYRRLRIGPSDVSSTAHPSAWSSSRSRSASAQSFLSLALSLVATRLRTSAPGSSEYLMCTPSTLVDSSRARSKPKMVMISSMVSSRDVNSLAASGRGGISRAPPSATPHGVAAVEVNGPRHVEHVSDGLSHLPARERYHTVVGPGADEGFVGVGRGALGQLVLVVREAYVRTAAVDVGTIGQMFAYHRGALDVPARTPFSPGALPGRLARFGGLPQREVKRTPLEASLALLRLAHLFGTLVAQGSVWREALDRVVDVTVSFAGGVRVAVLYQLFDQGDHLG